MKRNNTAGYEICAVCGAITDVPVSTPIDMRENYEIGFGQLCQRCAGGQGKDILSEAQIMLAVKKSADDK